MFSTGAIKRATRGSEGGLLLDAVISVAVLTLVGSAVLAGLSTTAIIRASTDTTTTAQSIGRNQMEYIFSLPYQDPASSYPLVTVPQDYGVTADAEEYVSGDPDIAKIVVRVSHGSQVVLVLETLRVRS